MEDKLARLSEGLKCDAEIIICMYGSAPQIDCFVCVVCVFYGTMQKLETEAA
jgi:hypothetical protein